MEKFYSFYFFKDLVDGPIRKTIFFFFKKIYVAKINKLLIKSHSPNFSVFFLGKPQLTQLPIYQNYQNAIKVKAQHFLEFPFSLSLVFTLLSREKEKTFLGSKISFSFSSIASPLQF